MRREEWARIRRREMLAAYYEVLLDEGLQGASLAKIAKRVQAPPSLLIHYFGTKQQMTIELVDYLLERYHETYGALFESMADPLERLRALVDYLFSVEYHQLMDDRAFYALFYVSLTNATVRHAFARVYEESLLLVESTLAECMAARQMPRDDPHELAVALKALEEGYAFLIGGGADEAAKAEIGSALRKRALQLLGLPASGA
jgi:AcrR family transcriptional regulator